MDEKNRNVKPTDLAAAFEITSNRLQRELANLGWSLICKEAARLAHVDASNGETLERRVSPDNAVAPDWSYFVAAAKEYLPHLNVGALALRTPPNRRSGYVYVLYDGVAELSKIGHTRTLGNRQRDLMGGHGRLLANVVNAKVADCRAAEAQCHAHFAKYRTNGEWFSADVMDIVEYIGTELDWLEIDFEHMGRLVRYMLGCRFDMPDMAKNALTDGRGRAQQRKPTGTQSKK